VTIRNTLPLVSIPVTLRLPRRALRLLAYEEQRRALSPSESSGALDALARRITGALVTYAEGAKQRSRGACCLLVDGRTRAELCLERADLLRLNAALDARGAYAHLRLVVRMLLLPDELLHWSERPLPRGRSARSWPLATVLPFLLMAAEQIVQASAADGTLQQRIANCIVGDDDRREYWNAYRSRPRRERDRALGLLLVDRALAGAWQRYGVQSPLGGADPEEFLRSHSYGLKSRRLRAARDWLKRHDPAGPRNLREIAGALLLGPPGCAAAAYALVCTPGRTV